MQWWSANKLFVYDGGDYSQGLEDLCCATDPFQKFRLIARCPSHGLVKAGERSRVGPGVCGIHHSMPAVSHDRTRVVQEIGKCDEQDKLLGHG
jgi:hypothetical protein